MSTKRLNTWQKATALVPLALLSGAWTASLAVPGAIVATAATSQDGSRLPDGTTVPNEALEAPASVSQPGSIAAGVPAGASQNVISTASTNGIPAAALAAYQRGEQVINSADPSCKIDWELIAAIGRVESDHGRYGGNTLNQDGKSTPGIYGIPLDGTNGTAKIPDTDAAQYDNDPVFDRAVGPMQFIPSTWSVVGVDGDGDDERDPQDIDDAALATAVYLCSGGENLSTPAGQQSAVYRYNHSQEYVDLVLSIMESYMIGDYSAVPNGVAAPTVFTPDLSDSVVAPATSGKRPAAKDNRGGAAANNNQGGSNGSTGGSTGGTGGTPTGGGDGGNVTEDPAGEVTDDPGGNNGGDDGGDQSPTGPVEDTVKDSTDKVKKKVGDSTGGGSAGGSGGGVDNGLSAAEAEAQCIADGVLAGAALQTCIANLVG